MRPIDARAGLARLSLFRWRLEWLFLVIAATGLVFAEQAREARQRDPFRLFEAGHTAAATVEGVRQELVTTAIRRGQPQIELRTYLDLAWFDRAGTRKRVTGYRLDTDAATALQIDAKASRWPSYVNVQHLEREDERRRDDLATPYQNPASTTSPQFQHACQPTRDCRLVVLLPDGPSSAEREIDFIANALDWGPRAAWLGLLAFLLSLGCRFWGLIDNPPSLE